MVKASRSRPLRSRVHVNGNVKQPPLRITRWALPLIRSLRRWALFFFLLLHHGPAGELEVSNYTSPSPPPGVNSVLRHLLHVLPPRVSNLLPRKHWTTPQKSENGSKILLTWNGALHLFYYFWAIITSTTWSLWENIFRAQCNSALPYMKYQICFVISVPASLEDGSAAFFALVCGTHTRPWVISDVCCITMAGCEYLRGDAWEVWLWRV